MTENSALKLKFIKDLYRQLIRDNFEFKAKDCGICETKGACCQDEHFVNVHITRLEAEAILQTLENIGKTEEVLQRNRAAIEKYDLTEQGDTYRQTYSCPLFEKEAGCLVHKDAKPVPCIHHACYERQEDLPPQYLQDRVETQIEALNDEVYGEAKSLPLPLWLKKLSDENCN